MAEDLDPPPTAREIWVDRLASFFVLLGGLLLVGASALTVVSIIGGAVAKPVPGEIEVVEILCGLAVFAFLPFCQLRRGHVGVDLLLGAFGPKAMDVSQLVGDFVVGLLFAILTWRMWAGLVDKFGNGETTTLLLIPIWWGYAAAFVLMVVNLIVCLSVLVTDFNHIRRGSNIVVSAGGH